MNKVQIVSGTSFEVNDKDSIARAALRYGIGFPYECNSGSCGTCKFTLIEGEVEDLYLEAPGLSERDLRKGRKLGCQCRPLTDITIKVFESETYIPKYKPKRQTARLRGIKHVTHNIQAFTFEVEKSSDFIAGQYALLEIPSIGERAYSMSNLVNTENLLEFFIKKVPGGKVSEFLFDAESVGKHGFLIDGPYGIAHIRDSGRDRICVAGGSGLAPMIAIARHHIIENAQSELTFIFGGQKNEDVLTEDEFRALVGDDIGVIQYISAVSDDNPNRNNRKGYLHEILINEFGGNLESFDIYCAGPPAMTNALEKMLYSTSFPTNQLYFDRFS